MLLLAFTMKCYKRMFYRNIVQPRYGAFVVGGNICTQFATIMDKKDKKRSQPLETTDVYFLADTGDGEVDVDAELTVRH